MTRYQGFSPKFCKSVRVGKLPSASFCQRRTWAAAIAMIFGTQLCSSLSSNSDTFLGVLRKRLRQNSELAALKLGNFPGEVCIHTIQLFTVSCNRAVFPCLVNKSKASSNSLGSFPLKPLTISAGTPWSFKAASAILYLSGSMETTSASRKGPGRPPRSVGSRTSTGCAGSGNSSCRTGGSESRKMRCEECCTKFKDSVSSSLMQRWQIPWTDKLRQRWQRHHGIQLHLELTIDQLKAGLPTSPKWRITFVSFSKQKSSHGF